MGEIDWHAELGERLQARRIDVGGSLNGVVSQRGWSAAELVCYEPGDLSLPQQRLLELLAMLNRKGEA